MIKKDEVIFRIIAALTAGFFWLAISRFLSSYDDHVDILERTAQRLTQVQQVSDHMLSDHEARIKKSERRIAQIETDFKITKEALKNED